MKPGTSTTREPVQTVGTDALTLNFVVSYIPSMENKSQTTKFKNLLLEDIMNQLMSFQPVVRNGWAIKFSTHRDDNILLIFTSVYTARTVVRYFTEEQDAVKFINFMMTQDPQAQNK